MFPVQRINLFRLRVRFIRRKIFPKEKFVINIGGKFCLEEYFKFQVNMCFSFVDFRRLRVNFLKFVIDFLGRNCLIIKFGNKENLLKKARYILHVKLSKELKLKQIKRDLKVIGGKRRRNNKKGSTTLATLLV